MTSKSHSRLVQNQACQKKDWKYKGPGSNRASDIHRHLCPLLKLANNFERDIIGNKSMSAADYNIAQYWRKEHFKTIPDEDVAWVL